MTHREVDMSEVEFRNAIKSSAPSLLNSIDELFDNLPSRTSK